MVHYEVRPMSDALVFGIVFIAFVVLRIVAATIFFFCLLPDGDRCPNCDTPTLRIQSRGWNLLLPWFRTSWCYACNWEGLLRNGALSPQPETQEQTRHNVKT
jgi:hypothetical protein